MGISAQLCVLMVACAALVLIVACKALVLMVVACTVLVCKGSVLLVCGVSMQLSTVLLLLSKQGLKTWFTISTD